MKIHLFTGPILRAFSSCSKPRRVLRRAAQLAQWLRQTDLDPTDMSETVWIPMDRLAPSSLCNIMVESPFAKKPGKAMWVSVKPHVLGDTKHTSWRKKGGKKELDCRMMES